MHLFNYISIFVVFAGWRDRWAAHGQRIAPHRHFSVTQRGWWMPPFPAAGEFTTEEARRLEVRGRVLMAIGVIGMLVATTFELLTG